MTAFQALEMLRSHIVSEMEKPAYDITRDDRKAGISFDFKNGVLTAYGKTIAAIDNLIKEAAQ